MYAFKTYLTAAALVFSISSVDARERKIPLTPIAYYYNGLSFTFLPNAPSLSTVLLTFQNDDGINERIRLLHLAEYSGRFTSTYLSKFLL